jgi:hypothetical protein
MILRPDFLASITASNPRWSVFRNHIYRRFSCAAVFPLPWIIFLIQIVGTVAMYHCPSLACFFSKPSTVLPFSLDESDNQPLSSCDRVLMYGGGRRPYQFPALAVEPYITAGYISRRDSTFKFVDHFEVGCSGQVAYPIAENFIHTNIPLCDIVPHLSVKVTLKIARLHHLPIGSHTPKSEICLAFKGHDCNNLNCKLYSTVFAVVDRFSDHKAKDREDNEPPAKHLDNGPGSHRIHESKKKIVSSVSHASVVFDTSFPPAPVDNELSQKIINDFCVASSPSSDVQAWARSPKPARAGLGKPSRA